VACTFDRWTEQRALAPSTCEEVEVARDGDRLTICGICNSSFLFLDPAIVDCAGLGGACVESGDSPGCVGRARALCSPRNYLAVCHTGVECVADSSSFGTCTP